MNKNKNLAQPISASEYRTRISGLLSHPGLKNSEGFVWWASHCIFYLSGFAFVPTERPIALLINNKGETALFLPRLEKEHAEAYAHTDRIFTYPEYPDYEHPMVHLADYMKEFGIKKPGSFSGDSDGYGKIMGYNGPRLSDLTGLKFSPCDDIIEQMMQIKSPAEISLIRESAYWAGKAHEFLQSLTAKGRSETEVQIETAHKSQQMLLKIYKNHYRSLSMGSNGPSAGYRGQIGRHSALPHSLNINAVFKKGDTLVTGAGCPMFGYYSELERTMFIGEPSRDQARYFSHMLSLQELAIDACRPGITCSSIDSKVREYYRSHNLMPHWRHHTGHCIGIRYHEGPFLDVGDERVIQPGMVFTVEPGIYVEGLGGFRHSDTILVTSTGPEFLTHYPRDIESLIVN